MKRVKYFLLILIFLASFQTLVTISADSRLWPDFTHEWKPDTGDNFRVGREYTLEAILLDENGEAIQDEIIEVILMRPGPNVNAPYVKERQFTGTTDNEGVARVVVTFSTDVMYLVTVNWNGNDEYRGMGSSFDVPVKRGGGFGLPMYGLAIVGTGAIAYLLNRRRTRTARILD